MASAIYQIDNSVGISFAMIV